MFDLPRAADCTRETNAANCHGLLLALVFFSVSFRSHLARPKCLLGSALESPIVEAWSVRSPRRSRHEGPSARSSLPCTVDLGLEGKLNGDEWEDLRCGLDRLASVVLYASKGPPVICADE